MRNLIHTKLFEDPDAIPEHRMQGRSTALAFKAIADAILNQGTRIVVKDHHTRIRATRSLVHRIENMVKFHKLVGFSKGRYPEDHPEFPLQFWIMCDLSIKEPK